LYDIILKKKRLLELKIIKNTFRFKLSSFDLTTAFLLSTIKEIKRR